MSCESYFTIETLLNFISLFKLVQRLKTLSRESVTVLKSVMMATTPCDSHFVIEKLLAVDESSAG